MKIADLNEEERKLVYMLIHEYTIPAICAVSGKRNGTVKAKVSKIYFKLQVKGRIGLIKQHYEETTDELLNSLSSTLPTDYTKQTA